MKNFTKKGLLKLGIMNLKAQDRICKFLRFTKLIALIFTLCVLSCVTAQAEDVSYVDENGIEQTVDATVLKGGEGWLPEGWYVVQANSSPSYERTLLLGPNADVRIILADGGAMTIDASSRGIQCNESGLGHLYIYGQKEGSGTLTINSQGTGIKVVNYTQNGGTVNITAKGPNTNGIFAASTVKINGGNLTINSGSYAIYAGDYAGGIRHKGYITINDGQVSADTGFKAGPIDIVYGSRLKGEITLGLKNNTGYIKAGGYEAGTVRIADNETLFIEGQYGSGYSGTLTANQISAIETYKLVLNTAYLCNYIDENGSEKSVYATPITTSTTTLSDGWYVVSENTDLTSTLSLSGNSDVNIILADGKTLNIGTNESPLERGINDSGIHNLRIYGQSEQTGTLNIYARYPINVGSSFTQNGGKVILSASGNSQEVCGIYAEHTVNINNGTLNITVSGAENSHAVLVGYNDHTTTIKGGITISGGTVTVTGADLNADTQGTITLGYRHDTDSITAASYTAGTVQVASGQVLVVSGDTENLKLYSGDITASKDKIEHKALVPYESYTISYDYALSADESLLNEGYIMLVSLDESASNVSLTIDNTAQEVFSVSGYRYIAILDSSDLSASKFTLKATNSGTTSFIFVSENPADDLTPGTHDIRLNSTTTKGIYGIIAVNAGDLNPGAYATSALPLTLVNPTRKGYTFTGWTTSSAITLTKTDDGYQIPANTAENLELTANWELTSYTITRKGLDGAKISADHETYTIYTDTFTLNNPTKDNYTFLGWTGTGLNGAAQSVTIPKGSTGNREYTAVWQESFTPTADDTPEIAQHAMILGSQIVVVFHVYLPEGSSSADYKMDFDVSGDKAENPGRTPAFEAITEGSHTLYGYKCYVNSVQMADTIHAKLYSGDTVVLSEDYTAKTYLDRVIASADVFSSATVNLCKAIKDYGHYVQIPLSKENKWDYGVKHKTMDAENTYDTDDVLLAKQGAADYELTKENAPTFTYALYLDSKTTLQVSFDSTIEYLACASGDVNNNIVTIADISAHELGNKYKITGKATSDFIITISPLSYVESVLNDNTEVVEGIKNGVTSLYNYYYRTMKYRLRHSAD